MVTGETTPRLTGLDSVQGAIDTIEQYFENGWTDGLPVVPPTEEAVRAMVAAAGRDPLEVLGIMPPRQGVVTVEVVATNAVMAGCRPEYMPVVLAAVEALLDPQFDVRGLQATSDPAAPMVIVTGPVVEQVGINHGVGLFGHGSRANATIGRAVRLLMVNAGGGHPDSGDKSTLGSPAKYSYCIGADVDTPWAPVHTEFGFDAEDSCVTVYASDAPRGNNPGGSGSMELPLWLLADSMSNLNHNIIHGGHVVVVISPLIARLLSEEGWTKQDVKLYLYERARVPVERVQRYKQLRYGRDQEAGDLYWWPHWLNVDEPNINVPVVRHPDNVLVLVAGDSGRSRSAYCPARPYNRPVTKKVRLPA
ncbi:MAG: hypothetical protein IH870_08590 [Chloroflexi bacterium]|nr:hypothetical protein [Chloroflexota bacterium]